jgi:NAD dependent epimerase/dehydratase family enzyme
VFVPLGPPDQALKLALGEVAGIVTTGQRVLPAKALALEYRFKYPQLADALRAIFTRVEPPAEAAGHPVAAGAGSHHH